MPACAMVPTGVIYWLKNALYVGLTNRTRGLSLVASRGPGFAMPAASGFAPLAAEPSVDDVVAAIYDAYDHDERKKALGQDVGRTQRADGGATDPGVVFAGLGDPLLRWRDVAAIAAAIIILTTGWIPADPILSVLVALLVLVAGVRIARQSGHILLEGTPEGLSPEDIRQDLVEHVAHVSSVAHIHAWALTESKPLITLEVTAVHGACTETLRREVKARLAEQFDVSHATVEVVSDPLSG